MMVINVWDFYLLRLLKDETTAWMNEGKGKTPIFTLIVLFNLH